MSRGAIGFEFDVQERRESWTWTVELREENRQTLKTGGVINAWPDD